MGRYFVRLPDVGEGTTEAEIVAWHVAVGQEIREEDPLVDILTDKATVELPAPIGGTVVAINGKPGEKRPVGSELVVLDVAGVGNVGQGPNPVAAGAATTLSRGAGEGKGAGHISSQSRTAEPQTNGAAVISLSRTAGEDGEARTAVRDEPGEGDGQSGSARRFGVKPLASPAVRRRAWDLGIELQFVPGSGPGGRSPIRISMPISPR